MLVIHELCGPTPPVGFSDIKFDKVHDPAGVGVGVGVGATVRAAVYIPTMSDIAFISDTVMICHFPSPLLTATWPLG